MSQAQFDANSGKIQAAIDDLSCSTVRLGPGLFNHLQGEPQLVISRDDLILEGTVAGTLQTTLQTESIHAPVKLNQVSGVTVLDSLLTKLL